MITLEEMAALTTLYSQPHRYYHNIVHIQDCLTELENFVHPDFTQDKREIVETAIWYHDAVYNPYSKLNEYNSAMLTKGSEAAYELIMYTARHLEDVSQDIETHVHKNHRQCAYVMLDIDLAGFGKPELICAQHTVNIRREYYNTTDYDFYVGRLKFLEALSKRKSLYYTEFFYNKYHEQSQKNLKAEITNAEWYINRAQDDRILCGGM